MSFSSSFVPFQANNLDLDLAVVWVRLWDKNTNNFNPNWINLGFVKEGFTIDLPTEKIEAFFGIPQQLIAQVISKINATAKFSLYEIGDINNIAFAFGQQPVNIQTSGTTARNEVFTNPNLNNIFTVDNLNGFKKYWLSYQPVDNTTVVVNIKDSTSPTPNTYNVSNQFIISTLNGRTALIPKVQTNIIDTSGLTGFTGPISELSISYNQLILQRQDTGFVRDLVLLNSPIRMVIIGRNLAPGTGELIAIRFSKALVKLSGSLNIGKPEFNSVEVEVAGLIEYPAGQSPISSTGNLEIVGYYKYPSTTNESSILADLF